MDGYVELARWGGGGVGRFCPYIANKVDILSLNIAVPNIRLFPIPLVATVELTKVVYIRIVTLIIERVQLVICKGGFTISTLHMAYNNCV